MTALKPVTLWVHKDEPAWSIREVNLVRPPDYQWHRWQIVVVVRNDELAEYWTDLGLRHPGDAPPCEIPSLGEHTVAEVMDLAEHYRLQDVYFKQRLREQAAASTLIPDYLNQLEERWKIINNQSVFGPGYKTQRDGFSKEAAHESVSSR